MGAGDWAGDLVTLSTGGGDAAEGITGDEDVVIYYLHGGAYCVFEPGNFVIFMLRMLEAVVAQLERKEPGNSRRRRKVALLALDYSLAPEKAFPEQLRQAERGYRWLVEEMGVPAGDGGKLVLMGDSAGGESPLL